MGSKIRHRPLNCWFCTRKWRLALDVLDEMADPGGWGVLAQRVGDAAHQGRQRQP